MSLLADERREYLQTIINRVNSSGDKIELHDLSDLAFEAVIMEIKMLKVLDSDISAEDQKKAKKMLAYAKNLKERVYNLYTYTRGQESKPANPFEWRKSPW